MQSSTYWERLQTRALAALDRFDASNPIQRLMDRAIGPEHYAAALREFYFYTRLNPAEQAALTLRLEGTRRQATRRMLGHAAAEVDHDLMALEDLARLGWDVATIPSEQPLPSTLPMMALPAWHLERSNAVGYLGQILFLELMPCERGEAFLSALQDVGVSFDAMTFVAEHAEADPQHVKLMRQHVEDLIQTEADFRAATLAVDAAADSYAHMLAGAFDSVDRGTSPLRRPVGSEVEYVG